jgi:hypothetical protein
LGPELTGCVLLAETFLLYSSVENKNSMRILLCVWYRIITQFISSILPMKKKTLTSLSYCRMYIKMAGVWKVLSNFCKYIHAVLFFFLSTLVPYLCKSLIYEGS